MMKVAFLILLGLAGHLFDIGATAKTLAYNNSRLPDPFEFLNGTLVRTASQFTARQSEISQLFVADELGVKPPKPSTLTATLNGSSLSITAAQDDKNITFVVGVTLPTTGTPPFPAIIGFDGGSIPIPDNVALLNFNVDDMAMQNDATSRGIGQFYDLYGANATASAMMAWAWGVSRIVDVLETLGSSATQIDTTKLGVTGCSRNGKGALVAGAFEPRIVLTIPQESGSGGSACWRLSDYMFDAGDDVQTDHEIVTENVWFALSFDSFVNDTATLPVDHHLLAGLVAPRGLYVIENTALEWLGPWSCWGCMKSAHLVYQAVGKPDNMGFSQVGNHTHCDFPEAQQGELTAYIDKFLFGMDTNTSVMHTDIYQTNGTFNQSFVEGYWDNFAVPKLY